MFAIFSACCISAVKAILYINLIFAVVILRKEIPHSSSWFSVLILMRSNENLHFNIDSFGNIGNFFLDIFSFSFSFLNSSLVGEDYNLVSVTGIFFDGWSHFLVEE